MISNPQLSVKQFAAIALNQTAPPWHLGKLLQAYNRSAVFLKPLISTLSSTPVVLFVSVRDRLTIHSVVSSAYDAATEQSYTGYTLSGILTGSRGASSPWPITWSPMGALPQDLTALVSGISVVYLDDSDTVGISGTFGQFANIKAAIYPFDPSQWTDAQISALVNGPLEGAFIVEAPSVSDSRPPTTMIWIRPGSPSPSAGDAPLGVLGLFAGQADAVATPIKIDAAQLAANHLEVTINAIISLLDNSIAKMAGTTSTAGLSGTLDVLNEYCMWLDYVVSVSVENAPDSVTIRFGGDFTVPEIGLQPVDTSQAAFSIPAFVWHPDG